MDPILFPTRQSSITLQGITSKNWHSIVRLVVNKDQLTLVPPNVESLCEHQFHPLSIVRAIYADSTPVGYIRLQQDAVNEQEEQKQGQVAYRLQCFMIDQACQGLGFGTKAVVALQDQLVAQAAASVTTTKVKTTEGADSCSNDSATTVTALTIKVSTTPFATVHLDDSPEHFFATVGFTKDVTGKEMVWVSRSL